jgi:hypothetical protein
VTLRCPAPGINHFDIDNDLEKFIIITPYVYKVLQLISLLKIDGLLTIIKLLCNPLGYLSSKLCT